MSAQQPLQGGERRSWAIWVCPDCGATNMHAETCGAFPGAPVVHGNLVEVVPRSVIEAVAAHANAIDSRLLDLRPVSTGERDAIDTALYNAVRAVDPVWWDREVPGLNAIFGPAEAER